MVRQGLQACLAVFYIVKIIASTCKEKLLRTVRLARIQACYPGIRFHHTADIQINGELDVRGVVHIGRHSRIYIESGAKLILAGRNMILDNVIIGASGCIEIGEDVSIQDNCIILGDAFIGQGTLLAPRVFISSGTHKFKGSLEKNISPWMPIKIQDTLIGDKGKQVYIGKDCWIGINSSCMPGSSIQDGCIVGANSIVIGRQLGFYCIYAGCPARLIGHRWIPATRQIIAFRD